MELFRNARVIRLRSPHDRYMIAEEDEETVKQRRSRGQLITSARWTVERVPDSPNKIRLISCYNKYLTASNKPFLLGWTGGKVVQTSPGQLDASAEWEPVAAGNNHQVMLRTQYGDFLRANGGMYPWKKSITHDIPERTITQDWVLWVVDIVEIVATPTPAPAPAPVVVVDTPLVSSAFSAGSTSRTDTISRQELINAPPSCNGVQRPKVDGRTIKYQILGENGETDAPKKEYTFKFKGEYYAELIAKLKKKIGMENIAVYTSFNERILVPVVDLKLPPNNDTVRVYVELNPSSEEGSSRYSELSSDIDGDDVY